MSRSKRAHLRLADLFAPENGWRALGFVMALALIYNGVAVGIEYQGRSLAPFLSSSFRPLVWPEAAWAALFLSVGIVALIFEVVNDDPAWRCSMQCGVFLCFCIAMLAVAFSQNPLYAAGRYGIGAFGALLCLLAAARGERLAQVEQGGR